jgi:hypothetical protein
VDDALVEGALGNLNASDDAILSIQKQCKEILLARYSWWK